MLTKSPLKVVLADARYEHYLQLKHLLTRRCAGYCHLFWFGNGQECMQGLCSGHFDLALVDQNASTPILLNNIKTIPHHTPIVLMVDAVTRDRAMEASYSGLFGLLDKHHFDEVALGYYLACAELFHQEELEAGFFADVTMLGHTRWQHGYTFIH